MKRTVGVERRDDRLLMGLALGDASIRHLRVGGSGAAERPLGSGDAGKAGRRRHSAAESWRKASMKAIIISRIVTAIISTPPAVMNGSATKKTGI